MEQTIGQQMMQRMYDSHPNARPWNFDKWSDSVRFECCDTHTEGTRLLTHEHMCDSFGVTGRIPRQPCNISLSQVPVSRVEYFDGVRSSVEEELKGVCESSSVL